jgi:hypothetical protein
MMIRLGLTVSKQMLRYKGQEKGSHSQPAPYVILRIRGKTTIRLRTTELNELKRVKAKMKNPNGESSSVVSFILPSFWKESVI